MTAPWNLPRRLQRFTAYGAYVVMIWSLASFFGAPGLKYAILAWLPLVGWSTVSMFFEFRHDMKHTKAMVDLGPDGRMSDLPGETQEEINMSWARRVLREKS